LDLNGAFDPVVNWFRASTKQRGSAKNKTRA
jgi:hypothetical protein